MTEAQIEALIQRSRREMNGQSPVSLHCEKCGNRLEPRCFDLDGSMAYAVFDNCTDLSAVQSYDTLSEAIEAHGA